VDVEDEIRKAREKLNDEMAQKEAKLAEEQKLLEEKMLQEREEYEKQIEALKKSGQRSSVKIKEEEQLKAQSTLQKFKGKLDTQRARAQWVRAAFTAGKVADIQPRMVEANRIASGFGVQYSFHFVDAIDPRSRRATFDDGGDEAVAPKRLLLQIKAEQSSTEKKQLWSIQKFQDRFVKMLGFANRPAGQATTEEDFDIFWDNLEHQLVGTAAIGVTPLLKLDLVREYITLRDFSGNVSGAVEVSMRMCLSSKPSMMRISTAAGSGVLKDQEVIGSVSFGRLSYENAESKNWGSFFVRFSWFDTEGRMEHVSPAAQAENLQYTFEFKQTCSESFLKFLEDGVMALQVRAYDRGVAAGELDIVKQKLKFTEDELERVKNQLLEDSSRYQEELQEARVRERVAQAKEEAKFEAARAQAAQQAAQASPTSEAVAPVVAQADDGAWEDMRYATLDEVKAELVRARGQVFKIQHDKDELKSKVERLEGNGGRPFVAPGQLNEPARQDPSQWRHEDMEQAHQHIMYLEMKVRALEELERKNEDLEQQVQTLEREKSAGGCEIS
ncbi:Kinesin-like protein KIF1C, partial [Durusdinium trenchii]